MGATPDSAASFDAILYDTKTDSVEIRAILVSVPLDVSKVRETIKNAHHGSTRTGVNEFHRGRQRRPLAVNINRRCCNEYSGSHLNASRGIARCRE